MDNIEEENKEKKYWGKGFYESRFNTVLLLILIILMVFAISIMLKNKVTYLPTFEQNDNIPSTLENTQKEVVFEGNRICPQTYSGTKECGPGFETLDGSIYALDHTLLLPDLPYESLSGELLIKGNLVTNSELKYNQLFKTYKVKGVIILTSVKNITTGEEFNTTTANITKDWKTAEFKGSTFRYPPDWELFTDSFAWKAGGPKNMTDYYVGLKGTPMQVQYGESEPYAGANDPYDVMIIKQVNGIYFSISKDSSKELKSIFNLITSKVM